MNYDVAFRFKKKKKRKLKEVSDFTVKLFFSIGFQRNHAKIIPNLFDSLSYTLSAFHLHRFSAITSKQLSTNCCSNVIVLLCTSETEWVQSLMRTLGRTKCNSDFKSITQI